jgi:hypothetical protein
VTLLSHPGEEENEKREEKEGKVEKEEVVQYW